MNELCVTAPTSEDYGECGLYVVDQLINEALSTDRVVALPPKLSWCSHVLVNDETLLAASAICFSLQLT